MPRPKIDAVYIEKIADLMLNVGIETAPAVTDALARWAVSRGYSDYPVERTVRRYMKEIDSGGLLIQRKREQFRWPESIECPESEISWDQSRQALDCVAFYLGEFNVRPNIGLVEWFVRVSLADSEQAIQQRALMAETFWCAEILGRTKGFNRPSTEVEELKLAFRTWRREAPDIGELVENTNASQFVVTGEGLKVALEMPLFAEELRKSQSFQELGVES